MLQRLPHALSRIFTQPATGYVPPKGSQVFVALSGGVDSTVSAHLVAKSGDYNVSGIYMRNWDVRDDDSARGCEWEREWNDVQRVCAKIGIPCELVDLSKEYWFRVFQPSIAMWEKGWTPNPDVSCNREIKFGALSAFVRSRFPNAWLATGHYARLLSPSASTSGPSIFLSRFPSSKDQTYYLCSTPLAALQRTYFPLGQHVTSKDTVKELAKKEEFHNWNRKESMGLCFVGERKRFADWLGAYVEEREGVVKLVGTEEVVAKHEGLWKYTIGQKFSLSGMKEKLFVSSKRVSEGCPTLYVAPSSHPSLYTHTVRTEDFSWLLPDYKRMLMHQPTNQEPPPLMAKLGKSRNDEVACAIKIHVDGSLAIMLEKPIYGISLGQTVMLSLSDVVLGGGTICETFTDAGAVDRGGDSGYR
ncbi:5-methylaminomethyl-2-thiouridylate-methyltransferase [Atractiella rhizophila]|nr:5-methylaminomethyl-2-thiouridylate-methyltransferase [Atractiella rhizophila]